MATNSPEAQPEPEFETDGTKGQMVVEAIDKAVADDPTRFTTRSFAVVENTGHSIRLINRSDARNAISIPWADLFALRKVINCILKDDPSRTASRKKRDSEDSSTRHVYCEKCGHERRYFNSEQCLFDMRPESVAGEVCGCKCVFPHPTGETGLTVEAARVELRGLFPAMDVVVGVRESNLTKAAWFFIEIGTPDGIRLSVSHPSLTACMAQVRAAVRVKEMKQ
jgi:hypothetical protein